MKKFLLVWCVGFLCPLHVWATSESRFHESIRGTNYTKGRYIARQIYLTSLKDEYTLEKRFEDDPEDLEVIGRPYEAHVRLYILQGDTILKKITSLRDLHGFVQIDSSEKAVEMVRLRTSNSTFFLFRPETMVEVFKRATKELKNDWIFGSCSPEFFEKHQLNHLEILPRNGYFVIHRYVLVCLWAGASDSPNSPTLYKTVENVYVDGKYTIEKELILQGVDFSDIPCQQVLF